MKHQSDIGLGEPEQLYVYSVLLYISLYLIGNNIYMLHFDVEYMALSLII